MNNLYSVLGVSNSATNDEIRKAFKKIASENHPDRFPGDLKKEQTFKDATNAFHVLTDSDKRSKYDRFLHHEESKKDSYNNVYQSPRYNDVRVSQVVGSVLGSDFFTAIKNRVNEADRKKGSIFNAAASVGRVVAENRQPTMAEINDMLDGGSAFADWMEDIAFSSSGNRGDGT